jgi:hypothetical protein
MPHLFITKALEQLGIEGTFLNIIKATFSKPTANIILNGETLKPFPLKSRMRQEFPLSSLVFNIVHAIFTRATRQEIRDSIRNGECQIMPICR